MTSSSQEPVSDAAPSVVANPPPAVPRAVTPLINRRAWSEPSVRAWWLIAISVLVVFFFYVGDRLWEREIERRLIRDGTAVQAKILGNSSKSIHGQTFIRGDIIELTFDWDGSERRVSGPIHNSVAVGETVTIRVDRSDPMVWTDLTETAPLLASMFVGLLFLPFAPLMFAVGVMKQRMLKSQWETGEALAAVVHDRRQTPIAPMSYAVRCSLRDQRDRRLFTVYVPQLRTGLAEGDVIWVISSYRQRRPVAALWFE